MHNKLNIYINLNPSTFCSNEAFVIKQTFIVLPYLLSRFGILELLMQTEFKSVI